jgi:hypothetical protein
MKKYGKFYMIQGGNGSSQKCFFMDELILIKKKKQKMEIKFVAFFPKNLD